MTTHEKLQRAISLIPSIEAYVVIVNCSKKSYWYSKKIGEIYPVKKTRDGYEVVPIPPIPTTVTSSTLVHIIDEADVVVILKKSKEPYHTNDIRVGDAVKIKNVRSLRKLIVTNGWDPLMIDIFCGKDNNKKVFIVKEISSLNVYKRPPETRVFFRKVNEENIPYYIPIQYLKKVITNVS